MTATLGFGWTYSDAGNYVVTEFLQDEGGPIWTREIDPVNYKPYLGWIAAGNTPANLPGNQFVTFPDGTASTILYPGYIVYTGGTPTYDSAKAAAAATVTAWTQVRATRDSLLAATDYTLSRHVEQQALVSAGKLTATKLTDADILEVQIYRQALRDITLQSDPTAITWPTKPDILT